MRRSQDTAKGLARINTRLLKAALLPFVVAVVSLFIGEVPLLGPLLQALAPDLLLISAVFVVAFIARAKLGVSLVGYAVVALAIPVLALNTRLPSFVHDLALHLWRYERLAQRPQVIISQPVRLAFDGQRLSARRRPYASASPACRDGQCFTLRGWRTPNPGFEGDYWAESPSTAVLDAGLRAARPQEPAFTLRIDERRDGRITEIELELKDTAGGRISAARYFYRNGFWLEPVDGAEALPAAASQTAPFLVNFLLHGNTVNAALSLLVHLGPGSPVGRFLALALDVKEAGPASAGVVLTPEVLGQELFDPPLRYMGRNSERAKSPWTDKSWDADRYKHCEQLLVREVPGDHRGLGSGWWRFAQDPTATHKIQRRGLEFCDSDVVWVLNYGSRQQQVSIKKYAATGDLLFDAIVQRPPPIEGYEGTLQVKTLHEQDGFVYFEWLDLAGRGFDLQVRRNMQLRFQVPGAGAPRTVSP